MDKMEFNRNSLSTFRLLGALSVLFGHAEKHLQISGGVILNIFDYIHHAFMGVPLFFCLSGFLIWNSVKTTSNRRNYFIKRFLRIYPEMWIAVIVEILAILLFYKEKIQYGMLAIFAVTQGTFFQFWTPDFLRGFGCGTPNGSLWTICVSIQFYIIIWIVRRLIQNKKKVFWLLLFAGSVAISFFSTYLGEILPDMFYKLYCMTIIPYLWLFILGLMMCEFSEELIPLFKKYWVVFVLVYLIIRFPFRCFDIILFNEYPAIGSILMMLSIVGFAYAYPTLNIKKDISYGIYIYHMIIINVMIQLGMIEKWYYLPIAVIVTVIISLCSSFVAGGINKQIRNRI